MVTNPIYDYQFASAAMLVANYQRNNKQITPPKSKSYIIILQPYSIRLILILRIYIEHIFWPRD